jgi:hypothetical protein
LFFPFQNKFRTTPYFRIDINRRVVHTATPPYNSNLNTLDNPGKKDGKDNGRLSESLLAPGCMGMTPSSYHKDKPGIVQTHPDNTAFRPE